MAFCLCKSLVYIMKKLLIITVLFVACSKSNDPTPVNFPVNGLLKTWQLASSQETCGSTTTNYTGGSSQRLILTSNKSTNGNYKGTWQGIPIEYSLKSDSILIWVASGVNLDVFVPYKKGIYSLANTLTITGKFTIDGPNLGCSFMDYYQ